MVQSIANKLKRVQHSTFCDTFSDVVLTGNCSVKIECYPPNLSLFMIAKWPQCTQNGQGDAGKMVA